MKKRNYVIHLLVFLMLIATFSACASTSKQSGTGEYVDDSVITTKVKSLLAADDFLKSFEISVETYKGAVAIGNRLRSQGDNFTDTGADHDRLQDLVLIADSAVGRSFGKTAGTVDGIGRKIRRSI